LSTNYYRTKEESSNVLCIIKTRIVEETLWQLLVLPMEVAVEAVILVEQLLVVILEGNYCLAAWILSWLRLKDLDIREDILMVYKILLVGYSLTIREVLLVLMASLKHWKKTLKPEPIYYLKHWTSLKKVRTQGQWHRHSPTTILFLITKKQTLVRPKTLSRANISWANYSNN